MGTDNLQKRRKQKRKERKSKELDRRSETWLIVCEGEKTEKKYFEDLFAYINSISKVKIKCKIIGTGKNTKSLVNSVDDFFRYSDRLVSETYIPYAKVFTVFDKDDFSDEQFNSAIDMSEKRGYIPLWSNQCIEFWFILHFEYLQSDIDRKQYFNKLNDRFGCKYKKNGKNFELLGKLDNVGIAIKRAKQIYLNNNGKTPAKMAPCTLMFRIFEEIESYLGTEISKINIK